MVKRIMRCGAALLGVVALVFGLWALPTYAVEDTPQAILDARNGVVRIICTYDVDYYVGMGTGFAVGTEDRMYIATNHHVIEDATNIYIFYDSGKSVEATIQRDDPGRDICILKPNQDIPGLTVLPINPDVEDSGIAVYALGYPGAADDLGRGYEEVYFDSVQEYLDAVTASKQSMTITDGIVSAIRDNVQISYEDTKVKVLQTNTAINGGNSGGPLLDRNGSVVGVNTFGIVGTDIQAMNGAVHASELATELDDARIRYVSYDDPVDVSSEEPISSNVTSRPETTGGGLDLVVILIIAGGVVVLGLVVLGLVVLVIIIGLRGRKKAKTLAEFAAEGKALDEVTALQMTRSLMAELVPLSSYDLGPLLTPQNLVVDEDTLSLAETHSSSNQPVLSAGLSAPEAYNGQGGQAASVYTVGATLYTLIMGRYPTDGPARRQANTPALPGSTTLQRLINRAMEPYVYNRIPTVQQLSQELDAATATVFAENGQHMG